MPRARMRAIDDTADVVSAMSGMNGDVQLRAALTAAEAGIWRFDLATHHVELSGQMRRLMGMEPMAVSVDPKLLEGALDDEERERLETAFAAAVNADGVVALDVRVRGADGKTRWLQISGMVEQVQPEGAFRGIGIALDISERKRVEQRLAVRDAVSRIIATADSLDEAIPEVLAAIADGVSMDVCGLWLPAAGGEALECVFSHVGPSDEASFQQFRRSTERSRFVRGQGLPGRVWETREAVWIESLAGATELELMDVAISEGLNRGVAIPLLAGSVMVGVVDVFSRQAMPVDDELLETLSGVGQKVGQFILRMRAEAAVRESDARQRLLVNILEAHREAEAPDAAMLVTSEALGRHLGVARVGFVEIVSQDIVFLPSWTNAETSTLTGSGHTSDIGDAFLTEIRRGRPSAITDVREDPQVDRSRLADIGVRSAISIPIARAGRWIASLYVHGAEPREWSSLEVRLVQDVADHTWDTVERLRSDSARRESETLARTISDNSSLAMILMDRHGYVRYANAACLEMMRFEGEDIRERPLHELVHHHHPDGRPYPRSECPIDQALPDRRGLRDHEDIFFRKDGSPFPVLCTASPVVHDGQADSTIIEIQDISASRAAAKALADSEKQFRGTFENAAVGVAHVGLDGHWLRVNRTLCQMVGYDEAELLKRTFQDITHPDDLERDLMQVRRILAGEIDTYTLEKRYVRGLGDTLWVELTVSVSRDSDGDPEYFIAVISDASARKLAESRMRTALAVKEEFLGLVSHELRTPMTVILGMSEILAGENVDLERARAIAADIADSAHELNELIESMLLLARLDQDEESVREPTALGRVVAASIARLRHRDATRRYMLSDPSDSIVDANPGLIDRVITNLLVNAAKYSTPGGPVEVVIENVGAEARLHVIDAGPGLTDDELGRVFEPFYRGPGTSGAPGAGLGLSVASRIMESLGGRMWAARHDGGSDFGFALPRLEPDDDD